VEEKAFKQIEDGLERKINNRQNKDLIDQQIKESVKVNNLRNLKKFNFKKMKYNKKTLKTFN
jgi:hypothetical protein